MAFEVIKLGQPIQKHWSWSGDVYLYPGSGNQLGRRRGVVETRLYPRRCAVPYDPCRLTLDDCDIGAAARPLL